MTKRIVTEETQVTTEETQVTTIESTGIQTISSLSPATVIKVSTKMEIAESLLPEEFQGQELETLDSGFEPTVKWVVPGNFVGGIFRGSKDGVGPNQSRLYTFEADGRPFGIWGTTALDTMMDEGMRRGKIMPGYKMLVIYMGSVETEKQPCKLFQIKVLKQK